MAPLTCEQGPAQRVKMNAAIQTLPSRSARVSVLPLRSVSEKSATGPRSDRAGVRGEPHPVVAQSARHNERLVRKRACIRLIVSSAIPAGLRLHAAAGEYCVKKCDGEDACRGEDGSRTSEVVPATRF